MIMEPTYAVELFSDVIEEARPFLLLHYDEISPYKDMLLEPDWELYAKLEKIGFLRIYVARINGQMVGYSVFFLRRHAHYNRQWAVNDIIWIHPVMRRQGVGAGLVAFWEQDMRAMGVSVVRVDAKVAHQALISLLVESQGYTHIGAILEKRLD